MVPPTSAGRPAGHSLFSIAYEREVLASRPLRYHAEMIRIGIDEDYYSSFECRHDLLVEAEVAAVTAAVTAVPEILGVGRPRANTDIAGSDASLTEVSLTEVAGTACGLRGCDDVAATNATSHRKKLEKERDKLVKQRVELQQFDEKLRHYADQRIHLDLDDGVKVNYGKFGDLLAEVKAVTGKKPA